MSENSLDKDALRYLHSNIYDFKSTAEHVESEIKRLGIRGDSWEAVPGMEDRTQHEVWVSMKTVSHFNLGVALELMLKFFLFRNNSPVPINHSLAELYDDLPAQDRQNLESIHGTILRASREKYDMMVFVNRGSQTAELPAEPPSRRNYSLRGYFEYFDQDFRLWEKRYSWERVRDGKWRHYLIDISAFVELINCAMRDIQRDQIAWPRIEDK